MAIELVPIMVKIGQKATSTGMGHKYPEFNNLDAVISAEMDWSVYVDHVGARWHYDKLCGHGQHDPENGSPRGILCGMLLVPQDFATQAVYAFPGVCTAMTAAEAEAFYDNRAHVLDPHEYIDKQVLEGIAAKQEADLTLDDFDERSLDPEEVNKPGVRRNVNKTFAGFIEDGGITVRALPRAGQ